MDPDVLRGIERVTGERYDPVTGTWQPDIPAVYAYAEAASASGGAGPDEEGNPDGRMD